MDAAITADRLVRFLALKPSYYVGDSLRHMTYEEAALYATRQRQQCASDNATLANGAPDPRWENRAAPPCANSPAAAPLGMDDETNQCAVCMAQPRDTLLRPCGHVAMCLMCAQRMLHQSSSPPTCVVCRSPIEDLLPIPNLAALPQSALDCIQAEAAADSMQGEDPQSDSQDDTQSDTQDDSSPEGSFASGFDGTTPGLPAIDSMAQFLQPGGAMRVAAAGHKLRISG